MNDQIQVSEIGEVSHPEMLAVSGTISLPEPLQKPNVTAQPTSLVLPQLTEQHKLTFFEIAKNDLEAAWDWLAKELGKL